MNEICRSGFPVLGSAFVFRFGFGSRNLIPELT